MPAVVPFYFVLVCWLLWPVGLHGQQLISQYHRLSYLEGMKGNSPQSHLLSRDGYLWVFTDEQLQRYDGHDFRIFNFPGRASIYHTNGWLFEDWQGYIWAGSYEVKGISKQQMPSSASLYLVSPKTGHHQSFDDFFQGKAPFSEAEVSNISLGQGGDLRLHISTRQGRVYTYGPDGFERQLSLGPASPISALLPNRDGTYWLGLPGEVSRVDTAGQVLESHSLTIGPAMLQPVDGRMVGLLFWPEILFKGEYVRRLLLEQDRGITATLRLGEASIPIGSVFQLKLQLGQFWHLVDNFDWRILNEQGELLFSFATAFPEEALGFLNLDLPTEMYFDQEGVAYTALRSKILMLGIDRVPFQHLLSGWRHSMRGIAQGKGDTLLLSSYNGISAYDRKRGQMSTVSDWSGDAWLGVLKQANGVIWAGAHGTRINVFDEDGQFLRKIDYGLSTKDYRFSVRAFAKGEQGRIWVGTSGGLAVYEPAKDVLTHCDSLNQLLGLSDAEVRYLNAAGGRIWMATTLGLYSMEEDGSDARVELALEDFGINHIYWENDERCWLATMGQGLWSWSPASGEVEVFNKEQDGLPDDFLYAVYPDKLGRLWLPSNRGLIWLAPKTKRFGYFTAQSGLPADEFNYTSHYQAEDGTLYLGGINGVTFFKPDDFIIEEDTASAAVLLANYQFPDNKTGLLHNQTDAVEQAGALVLSPLKTMTCQIKLSVSSYLGPESHKYAYWIEGLTEHWQALEGNTLLLSNLPYGRFTLHLRGCDNMGFHCTRTLSLPLNVQRPFYESLEFWLLVSVMLLLLGYTFFQLRLLHLQEAKEHLTQEVLRRTQRIEADRLTILQQKEDLERLNQGKDRLMSIVGHELRNNLFFLSSAADYLLAVLEAEDWKSAKQLSTNIQQSTCRMEDIIGNLTRWAMVRTGRVQLRKRWLDLQGVAEQLAKEYEPLAARKGITLELALGAKMHKKVYMDEDTLHIALQNLVRNAIKFTDKGGRVSLGLYEGVGEVRVAIEDNGIGIPPEQLGELFLSKLHESRMGTAGEVGTGLGLSIAQELIDRQGGRISVQSTIGKGSLFTVHLPLAKEDVPVKFPRPSQ